MNESPLKYITTMLGKAVGSFQAAFISFAVGLNWSLAKLLGFVGLGEWATSVGGLLTLEISTIANSLPFLLMLLILLIRPAGLMGDRQ